MEGVGVYTDVRANVSAGPAFVGKRTGRKTVAVHNQTPAVTRQHAGYRAFQLRVVLLYQACKRAWSSAGARGRRSGCREEVAL